MLLNKLEELIKNQLAEEYDNEERVEYEYDNLTVPRLLHMLAYMFDDNNEES